MMNFIKICNISHTEGCVCNNITTKILIKSFLLEILEKNHFMFRNYNSH